MQELVFFLNTSQSGTLKRVFQIIISSCKSSSRCTDTWGKLFDTKHHQRLVAHHVKVSKHLSWVYKRAFPKYKSVKSITVSSKYVRDLYYPKRLEFLLIIDY